MRGNYFKIAEKSVRPKVFGAKPKQAGKKEGGWGEGIFARLLPFPSRLSKGKAEGGFGGNSAFPLLNQNEASPATCLNTWKAGHHRKILFSLKEKEVRRAQNEKSKEYFSVVWRVIASGGGLASLVWFRSGVSDKMSSSQTVKTHHVGNCKFERFASLRSATNWYSILGVKTNSRFRILGEENFLIISRKLLANKYTNMNNQKGFANIVLIVLVVILVGAVGYFALVKKSPSENQPTNNLPTQQTPPAATNNPPATTPTPKVVDWESLIPSMRIALKQAFPNERIEESRPISIYKKIDVTGDGVPEVLVNLGTGGATTDLVTSMRIENDKPIAPLFKQKDGKISTLIFSAGAGGSGRYGSTAEMLGNKNAIYSASYSKYGESADYCRAEAYQWNSQTKIFEYNAVLSNEVQQDYCRTAGTGL